MTEMKLIHHGWRTVGLFVDGEPDAHLNDCMISLDDFEFLGHFVGNISDDPDGPRPCKEINFSGSNLSIAKELRDMAHRLNRIARLVGTASDHLELNIHMARERAEAEKEKQ